MPEFPQTRRLGEQLTRTRTELEATRAELSAAQQRIAELEQWLTALTERVEQTGGATEGQRSELEALTADQEAVHERIRGLERRVPGAEALIGTGDAGLEEFDVGLGGTVLGFRHGREVPRDRVYVDFENAFRGTEEQIRDRQRAYLPLLRGHGPVLDVGCGRGELLALLAEAEVAAKGIDTDAGMVARCHEQGLENVHQADGVRFLAQLVADSLGSVVALQVIEHLPYAALLEFLDASRRALAPGGRLIVETVNPHSPQALKHFWIDPTHQHPLFPEITLLLCRLSGFDSGFIWYPQGCGDPQRDRSTQLDYAVVAAR